MNNILVIEDNDADANLIKAYLKESNFKHRLFFSSSLIHGIDIIEGDDSRIDLVLLDLSLDDTRGYATLTSYLNKVDDVPVVVLTGNKNQIVGNQSVSAGAQDFLVKGEFNSHRLVNCIKYAIQRFKKEQKLKELYEGLRVESIRGEETEKIGRHGSWEMDLVNKKMSWSNALYRILGIPAYTLTPTKSEYLKIVHIEDKRKVETFFEEASKSKDVIRIEHRILLDNKQVKTIELSAKLKFEPTSNKIILYGYVVDLSEKINSMSLGVDYYSEDRFLKRKQPILQQISTLSGALEKLENKPLKGGKENIVLSIKNSLDGIKKLINKIPNEQNEEGEFSLNKLSNEIIDVFNSQLQNSSNKISFDFKESAPSDKLLLGDYHSIRNLIYATTQICIAGANANSSINISTKIENTELNRLSINFIWQGNSSLFQQAKIIYTQKKQEIVDCFKDHRIDLANMLINLDHSKAFMQIESPKGDMNHLSLSIPIEMVNSEDSDVSSKNKKNIKVLLVENHFIRRISLKKSLLDLSSDVEMILAESADKALKYLSDNLVDIAVVNMNLPDDISIPTIDNIIKRHGIPVIGVASGFTEEEKEQYEKQGVSGFFGNVNPPKELYLEIKRVLG